MKRRRKETKSGAHKESEKKKESGENKREKNKPIDRKNRIYNGGKS